MRSPDDTIVALSTPVGRGAIALIRLSGPGALAVASALFSSFTLRNSATELIQHGASRLGRVVSATTGELIDTGYMTFYSAGRSHTGQDVVELSCHGSPVVVERILEEMTLAGARMADPGEFTYRAVLNGRMDLAQAEGVRDLIDASTRTAASAAARQVRGELSARVESLRERLVEMICRAEAAVEFSEEPDVQASPLDLLSAVRALARDVTAFASTWNRGRRLREGARVVIAGRPNAGKSSLFNKLLDAPRAIVSSLPGTTRDYLCETIDLDGIPVTLVDTAGLRSTAEEVERQGVDRTREWMESADLTLVLCPVDEPLTVEDDRWLIASGPRGTLVAGKADLGALPWVEERRPRAMVSSKTGEGIEALRALIVEELSGAPDLSTQTLIVTNARHHAALVGCASSLERAVRALEEGMTEEVALDGLHAALGHLTEIVRPLSRDEMHDRIFSTFCLGK